MIDVDRHYSPGFALGFGRFLHAVTRVWFRYRFRHPERLPAGKVLYVGNHSGIGIVDVLCMLGAWSHALGGKRRAVGMMHKMFIGVPPVSWFARGFGAVEARPEAAKQAFARGYDVACFPGGDLDSCRPFYDARKVEMGTRRGYARLALEEGVPIVPIATIGSHHTYTLLPGGAWIARVTGMKRWARCERFPLVLGVVLAVVVDGLAIAHVLPWWSAIVAALAAIVPTPVRVTTEVLPPIDVVGATAHIDDPEARLEAVHGLVHGALSARVATMQHEEAHDAGSRGAAAPSRP